MYSVVLMMAMTTGGETPDLGHRHGGCGGGGCSGYVAASCGCGGGGGGGGGHHFLGGHHHHSCSGGGCSGYSGGYSGCTGSYGGGYGGGYGGCTGSYGGGGYVPGPGCVGGHPGMMQGSPGMKSGEELRKMPKEDKNPKTGMAPAPATLIVSLPADAKLVIDDTTTASTSAERTFVSPNLNPGQDYNYTLKVEVVRNGKTIRAEEKVTVRAGEETRVTLLSTTVAAR